MPLQLQGLFELGHLGRGSLLLTTFPAYVLFLHMRQAVSTSSFGQHWTKMHLMTLKDGHKFAW